MPVRFPQIAAINGLPPHLAESIGLGVSIYVLTWGLLKLACRRMHRPPRLSAHAFALSLGVWTSGLLFFKTANWVDHAGAALIFTTAVLLWVLMDRLVFGAWLSRHRKIHVPIILRQLGGTFVVLIVGSFILKLGYNLELTALLATSGIAAVILGFAMQDLLSNVIAGFSIHMTRAYKVGDWLLLGDKGDRAEVTEINWRSTRLVNNDHVSYELPNSDIVKNRIINLNYPSPEHGIRLRFGADYDVPPAIVKQALIAAATGAEGVIDSPKPNVFLIDFSDHCVIYELRVWMHHAALYNITCDQIRTAVWYEFKRRDIRIPFPIRSLEVRKPNEPAYFADAKTRACDIITGKALSCLQPEEARTLVDAGSILLFGTGETLVSAGESGDSMFIILNGSVHVTGKNDAGAPIVLATLSTGDCFGEISLLTGEPRNATVTAASDALVLQIHKTNISPLIAANPALAESLGELLEKRLSERDQAMRTKPGHEPTKSPSPQQRTLTERIITFFSRPAD